MPVVLPPLESLPLTPGEATQVDLQLIGRAAQAVIRQQGGQRPVQMPQSAGDCFAPETCVNYDGRSGGGFTIEVDGRDVRESFSGTLPATASAASEHVTFAVP